MSETELSVVPGQAEEAAKEAKEAEEAARKAEEAAKEAKEAKEAEEAARKAEEAVKFREDPSNRVMQLALYYDFVLYNMQQKPFGVLLSNYGGAILSKERGLRVNVPNPAQPSLFSKLDPVNTIHDALVKWLLDKSNCNINELKNQIADLQDVVYKSEKINEFKGRGKTTPAALYDLLNPGEGDINAAIQNAAAKIMAYAPSRKMMYLGDEVFHLVLNKSAGQFLTDDTVAAMSTILSDPDALPPKSKGGRTKRRGTRRRGPKRHNRRSCKNKNKKRTRRH
jgi:hypothetical protein